MTDVFNEALPHNEGFIISEANGRLSRKSITVAQAAEIVKAGTVLGERDDGKFAILDPNSSEGETAAKGVLCSDVDSTAGDADGVMIDRLAEVREDDLVWIDGITDNQKTTAKTELLALNIKVRTEADTVSTQST